MRWNDLNNRSIKTLLILILLFANIAVALSRRGAHLPPAGDGQPRFVGRVHPAVPLPDNQSGNN